MKWIPYGIWAMLVFPSLIAYTAEPQSATRSSRDRYEEEVELLSSRLNPQSPLSVQLAAIEALRQLPHEPVSEALLKNWPNYGPRVHRVVVSVLLWREPYVAILDDQAAHRLECEASRDWALRDIWVRHPSAAVRARADRLRKPPATSLEIRDALERFLPAASMTGDPTRGRHVFTEATCAQCHRVEDLGRHIGPDLSQLADRSPRALLIHTIDPNRVVERQYIEYTILTEHGLFISGFLFDETEDCIRLADGQGELKRVRRGDIDEWESTYRSQMPEGLEGNRTLQEMADLITFIVGALPSDECQLGPTN